ncbi:MAG: PEP-CTERM sorting domain-containing protein [Acidobacteriaceae bacterium]|nr:PEP-CTERM sorting domain-containing protein [Acidobacteriaceae bacterium]MBV9502074.1 PEP-CTERM sorting domain-containing protein [Acidobacteriaceae bacterium]
MNSLRYLVAFLFVTAPLALQASHPTIIVNGDPPNITVITNTSFTFGANSSGGGDFSFQNETGQNWTKLDIFVTLPTFQSITCGSVAFVTCTVTTTTPAGASPASYDLVFGPDPNGGILNGELFSINLNNNAVINLDPNGVGDWGPGRDFDAKANFFTPEPGSWMLIALGLTALGGFCIYRRRRPAA